MNEILADSLIKVLSENPNSSYVTPVLIIVFCVGWLFERLYKLRLQKKSGYPTWRDFNQALGNKVNGRECRAFRTRIGKESDEHREGIKQINTKLSDIQSGVSYIRGNIDKNKST